MFPSRSKEGAETRAHAGKASPKSPKSAPKRRGGAASRPKPKSQLVEAQQSELLRRLRVPYFEDTYLRQRTRKLTSKEFNSLSNWLSSPRKCEPFPKIIYPGYNQDGVLDCILEHVISLLVYKYKFEKSLESKIGLFAKPSADDYLKGIYSLRATQGRIVYPISNPPLTLHEQNCLASHPLWASTQHNKRFHIPWKSSSDNMLTVTDFYRPNISPSKSSALELPEIASPSFLTSNPSSLSLLPLAGNSVEQIKSKTSLPKI
uniref:Uncharacterized protein LOC117365723 n=1 Tax=Geotrypetes seraphini TaxID=260995 RepID=A0A6P8S6N3_GEOSA|nr:uncharacterized protein LOC117365723 [Geotrypetes seraphini]